MRFLCESCVASLICRSRRVRSCVPGLVGRCGGRGEADDPLHEERQSQGGKVQERDAGLFMHIVGHTGNKVPSSMTNVLSGCAHCDKTLRALMRACFMNLKEFVADFALGSKSFEPFWDLVRPEPRDGFFLLLSPISQKMIFCSAQPGKKCLRVEKSLCAPHLAIRRQLCFISD